MLLHSAGDVGSRISPSHMCRVRAVIRMLYAHAIVGWNSLLLLAECAAAVYFALRLLTLSGGGHRQALVLVGAFVLLSDAPQELLLTFVGNELLASGPVAAPGFDQRAVLWHVMLRSFQLLFASVFCAHWRLDRSTKQS